MHIVHIVNLISNVNRYRAKPKASRACYNFLNYTFSIQIIVQLEMYVRGHVCLSSSAIDLETIRDDVLLKLFYTECQLFPTFLRLIELVAEVNCEHTGSSHVIHVHCRSI